MGFCCPVQKRNSENLLKKPVYRLHVTLAWSLLLPFRTQALCRISGMHGNYGPNLLTNEADLIIAIGMRFDDRVTGNLKKYAKKARIIHIEIDEAEINKNVHGRS